MISCIITHHLNENDWLLTRCIESLLADPQSKEILVISDAPKAPQVKAIVHHATDGSLKFCCRKANYAAKHVSPSSQAFFLLSDDVVIVPGSAKNLFEAAMAYGMLLNGIGNFDDINIIDPGVSGFARETDPATTPGWLPQIAKIPEQLPFIFPTNRLYMYATMVPRFCWDKIGEFDERFECGFEDDDYSVRASLSGIRLGTLSNAFVLHYGHQTVSKLPKPDPAQNHRAFFEKHGVMNIPPLAAPGFGAILLAGLHAYAKLGK